MPWNLLKKLSNADTSQRIGPENKKLPTLRWIMTFLALQMLTWKRNDFSLCSKLDLLEKLYLHSTQSLYNLRKHICFLYFA